ncbi:MAG: hypothetical protein JW814_09240 [Candidatus Krumholzibacteriota bacterium]|nr:hypothetical protein [Candidatus Krumholzibacteriota bacterium]
MMKGNIERKSKKRIIVINAVLFAALFGLISFNKEVLRPSFSHITALRLLTGCLPNFLAAWLISLAFVNAILTRDPKYGRLFVWISSVLIFIILAIEEIKPMWGASTHFDPYDIIASAAGSLLAIVIYESIMFVKSRQGEARMDSIL